MTTHVIALVACTAAACVTQPDHVVVTEPTIWLQKSASIDPTKLPLCDQCYNSVTDGATPKKGYAFVCDPKAYQQTTGPGGIGGPWIDQARKTFDFTARPIEQGQLYWDDA